MIHHSIVAAKIFLLVVATKMMVQTSERKERPLNGKRPPTNANRVKNDKKKDKGLFKGKNRLSPEEMEHYHKEHRCYKCGEQGHAYCTCPFWTAKNDKPQTSKIATQDKIKKMMHHAHVMHGEKHVTKTVLSCLTQDLIATSSLKS